MAVKLFPTLEAAEAHILKHELTYTVKYVSRKQEKSFTQPIDAEKLGKQGKRFIMRCPSIVIGVKVMQCQNGRDMAKKSKAKRMALSKKLADDDHAYKRQTRDITQDTIKMDCPAMLKIKRIVRFPDYKLATGKESRRHKKSKLDQLRACKEPLRCEEVFQLTLPDVDCHSTHNVGKAGGMLQGIDGGVKAHIKLMVSQGVNFLSEMHPHLQQYIQQRFAGLPLPVRSNRRFWPTDKDITNHMQAAFTEILGSGGDQENCVRLVEEWKAQYPDDSFHFRPYQKDGARLLFVHQTEKQKHLMQRYGNELSCLDATYKTTKFSTYLFFIVVKTNLDYQIAATFITMDETTSAISEAVGMVKGWNPQWSPRAWMVDCAQSEISALEDLFPDAKVLLCKFHREQARDRQLKRKEYGIGESLRQVILGSLRRLADARTEDRYLQEKRAMEGTNWWLDKANQRFIEYLQHQWMADDMPKRWVECYRLDRFLFSVNTNNGIERVNRYFKQNSLRYKTNNSLSRTLHILVTHTAPNKMKSYTVANDMCSSLRRKYGAKIPSYMHNRPKVMGKHCKKRLEEGRLMVEDTARLDDEDGRYTVQSQATADVYKVSLTEPSCECKDYQRSLYPCKHIYAVLFSEGKTFMDLPAAYVNSPWFQLDYKIMSLGSVISQPQPGEFGSKDHCEAEYPETEDAHVEMEMQGVETLDDVEMEMQGVETLDELPKPMRVQLTTASECRELLRQLTSLSYKVTDDQLLRDLCQSLHASIATLNSHCGGRRSESP